MDRLTDTVVELASTTTAEAADRVAAAFDAAGSTFARRRQIERAIPASRARDLALELNELCTHDDGPGAGTVAAAVRAAARTAQHVRGDQQVDLVWTGPTSEEFAARRTDVVLHQVIRAATHEIVLMSYASYDLPEVADTLIVQLERGITLRFLFETTEDSDGRFRTDGKDIFGHLADHGNVHFYRWPLDQRPTRGSAVAAMHAKVALADDHTMLVTSANLTDNAMRLNMELGLHIRGGPLPVALNDHFHRLLHDGVIQSHL